MGLVRLISVFIVAALACGCASSGAVPRPFPGAPAPMGTRTPPEGAPDPEDAGETPRVPGAGGPPEPEEVEEAQPAGGAEAPFGPPDAAETTRGAGAALVETALGLRGVPYRPGGTDPSGFDCSGFVQYVFAQHGIALPRETREQLRYGDAVRLAGIEAGDLIFFAIVNGSVSHVGVAIGGDEFVHAPSTRGVVRVEKFSAPYWASRIVGVRRMK